MLTSQQIKYYSSLKQKKYREKEKKFLIEGFHLLDECLHSSYEIELVTQNDKVDPEKLKKFLPLLKKKNVPFHIIKESLFNKLKDTENSQGVIGVVKQRAQSLDNMSNTELLIALDRINDPGNLGTIIRNAYWFGADGIMLSSDCVELYNSKVIRSTQGALFHLNVYEGIDINRELNQFKKQGFTVYLMTLDAGILLHKINTFGKTIFVFGNEADGLSESLLNQDFNKVKIEGFSECESLNVSVSCGIALYHLKNVRRTDNTKLT